MGCPIRFKKPGKSSSASPKAHTAPPGPLESPLLLLQWRFGPATGGIPMLPNVPDGVGLDDPVLYINRELSWLEFNRRVLEEARDPTVPWLERLKFLAIVSSNLDEFFMVRVGGLQQKVHAGVIRGSGADRMPPRNQLNLIDQSVRQMVEEQYRCLNEEVLPALQAEGIVIRNPRDLTPAERMYLAEAFR